MALAGTPRALVCLLPGLGDALVASPLVRALAASGYRVDVLTMLSPVAEYSRAMQFVENTWFVPLLKAPLKSVPDLLNVRRNMYDEVYVPFPATRWQYAFVARFLASKQLIMHRYGGIADVLARLGRVRLIPLRGGHRAFENLRLLSQLSGVSTSAQYELPFSWQGERKPGLLGIHPGSMVYKGNEVRRWPIPKFVDLTTAQIEQGRSVRIFIGPSEREDLKFFSHFEGNPRFEIVDAPLEESARSVAQCEVFVANDAGFAHIAAGLGVKTITLFGMTSPVRAQPVGQSIALRPSACPPCHDEGLRTFSCVRRLGFRCMNEDFPVSSVLEAVGAAFAGDVPAWKPQEMSDYALYGRSIKVAGL